jgi:hypothetical protein
MQQPEAEAREIEKHSTLVWKICDCQQLYEGERTRSDERIGC